MSWLQLLVLLLLLLLLRLLPLPLPPSCSLCLRFCDLGVQELVSTAEKSATLISSPHTTPDVVDHTDDAIEAQIMIQVVRNGLETRYFLKNPK